MEGEDLHYSRRLPEPNVCLWSFGDIRFHTEALYSQSFALIKADNGIKYKDVESSAG